MLFPCQAASAVTLVVPVWWQAGCEVITKPGRCGEVGEAREGGREGGRGKRRREEGRVKGGVRGNFEEKGREGEGWIEERYEYTSCIENNNNKDS